MYLLFLFTDLPCGVFLALQYTRKVKEMFFCSKCFLYVYVYMESL